MTTDLNRSNAPFDRLIGASAPQQTGIVHLGLGNFHRAHAAVNTALAMADKGGDWGIVGVANRSRRVLDALAAQDGIYSLLELSPEGTKANIVDVHRRFLVADEEPAEVVKQLADENHKVITLTISENGYHRDSVTGRLDLASADIAADLADLSAPRSMVGRLGAGLLRRFEQSQAPVTVLSCDNLVSAGSTTRAMVTQFLEAGDASGPFWDWFTTSVAFPNAMVDRIVPSTDASTIEAVTQQLGLRDAAPVRAERFTMWVLEDHFAAGRPAWESAGAIFTDEVEAYELVKLRLLNGSHSLIAYLGGLDQQPTIPDSRKQEFIARCVDAGMRKEYLPSIALPTGFDAEAYMAQLFDRWNNTALSDQTSRVGSDGSTKLLQRVPEPALRMLQMGQMPQMLALTVAGWICCVCPPAGFQPGPVADAMIEPAKEKLAAATAGATTVRAHVESIMGGGFFPEALVAHDEFTARVAELAEIITRDGVRAAAEDALKG